MKQITVNGNTYTSIAAAWREESPEGLLLTTVRWRLRTGWEPNMAFLVPVVDPEDRRMFALVRGMIAEDAA